VLDRPGKLGATLKGAAEVTKERRERRSLSRTWVLGEELLGSWMFVTSP
jgi:hypothetical protein